MPDDGGDPTTDMIKGELTEAGHSGLATHVVLGPTGRPLLHCQKLDKAPSEEDVHAVHAATLRAYEAHAPEEIGEDPRRLGPPGGCVPWR
jgi:hypothetical protein